MQKATLLTAALAAPVLLSFAAKSADKISFAPAEGAIVTKTFASSTAMDLDEMEVSMNGQAMPVGDMEMSMEMSQSVTVTDKYGKVSDGRPASVTRTFDAIGTELEMSVDAQMGAQDMTGSGTSPLEGKSVVFAWDDEAGEFGVDYVEGEEGEAELLEGLTENMDLRGLLPTEELSDGDVYEIPVENLADLLAAGGDLKLEIEMDQGEAAGMMGPDPASMGDMRKFFDDVLEGEATGKYVGMKDVDGTRVAVIEISIEINGSADMSDSAEDMMGGEGLPEGMEVTIDRMDVAMTYEGGGELHWNVAKGVVHALEITADIGIDMDMAMDLDMGGQAMSMAMVMAMSGEVTTTITTE